MLKGIDVASWQDDIHPEKLGIDFCIAKATESTNYVNPYCDTVIQRCIKNGLLWGFYHFASGNDAKAEAKYFYDATRGYQKKGIPVLDYEIFVYNDVAWCEQFITKYQDLSKIWPIIYISASRCAQFKGSWIPSKCGLWVAGYPYSASTWGNSSMPYNVSPWSNAAIWQFTSSLQLNGYSGLLDGNYAYMSKSAWLKYAQATDMQPTPQPEKKLSYDELAREIINGKWSAGNERAKKLASAGYDASKAQKRVNEYYELANECIKGIWGNGWNRQNAIDALGYDYATVQMIVNALLR